MSEHGDELPTSVRLTPAIKAGLLRRAQADGRKLTDYIRNVLRLHVENTPEPKSVRSRK
jgi:hypothetical protein